MEQARVIDGRLCLSTAAMQDVFAVSRQALGNWAKSGCPKAKLGWWPLGEVIKWRGLANVNAGELSEGALKLKYETEIKRLKAVQLQRSNALADEEYISKADIIATQREHCTVIKRSLQGLSRKIATEAGAFVDPITARRIESQIAEVVNDALVLMSEGKLYVPPKRKTIKG